MRLAKKWNMKKGKTQMFQKVNLFALFSLLVALTFLGCSDDNKTAGGSTEDSGIIAINNRQVAGVAQKGPLVTGSTIRLFELDGETYAQTGKGFTGKISSDDGEFSIASVTLGSQYAVLEASGYYRNEVTGKKSVGTITLNAITDLNDRKAVNVNLLTHLEYDRALYLMGKGMKVSEAKKQAEGEIFNAFGIQGDFANSEDLNIFRMSEGDAALLAFSVLMQSDRNEAELTELLTKFSIDIGKDGEWNDEVTKARIANWAYDVDYYDGFSLIRSNINGWGMDAAIGFEKYVRNFWYVVYGLGPCGAKNKGEVAAVTNELVKIYGTEIRYICKDSVWVEATDFEKDTYSWKAGEDGELRDGEVIQKNMYKFDESLGTWLVADQADVALDRACVINRKDEIGKKTYSFYKCEDGSWRQLVIKEILDIEKCTDADEGKILSVRDAEAGSSRFYCSALGWLDVYQWRWDVPKDVYFNPEFSYGAMTDPRDGKEYKTFEIMGKVWMAENLNYADSVSTPSLKGNSWCYDNDEAKCEELGRFYTWDVAMEVCPDGWHLPTNSEWENLFAAVDEFGNAGALLKSESGWVNGGNGTDASGFAALPAGLSYSDGRSYYAGDYAHFWSASQSEDEDAGDYAYYVLLYSSHRYVNLSNYFKTYGYSVRCLQN